MAGQLATTYGDETLEHQAIIYGCESGEILQYPAYIYCDAPNVISAAHLLHRNIRNVINDPRPFFMYVIDELEAKITYFICDKDPVIISDVELIEKIKNSKDNEYYFCTSEMARSFLHGFIGRLASPTYCQEENGTQ